MSNVLSPSRADSAPRSIDFHLAKVQLVPNRFEKHSPILASLLVFYKLDCSCEDDCFKVLSRAVATNPGGDEATTHINVRFAYTILIDWPPKQYYTRNYIMVRPKFAFQNLG